MNNILFGTDFDESAKTALQLLTKICEHYDSHVIIMHVINSFWKNWLSSGMFEKEMFERLATWQEKLSCSNSDNIIVAQGNAADLLLAKAEELKSNLIVLGVGHHGESHNLTGSIAASAVRSAKTSVLLVGRNKIDKVLCGIDCSEKSAKTLSVAIDLCKKFQAKLCVAHVIPGIDFNPVGMEKLAIEQKEQELKNQLVDSTETFLQDFDFSGLEVEKLYPWGVPSRVIMNIAEDFDYDLCVIGAKGQSALKNVLMGSTAEKILHHTPCSLLVVR